MTEIVVLSIITLYMASIPVRLFIGICKQENERKRNSDIWEYNPVFGNLHR